MNNMDKFCLNWNGYDTNIRESFRKLREDQRLFDVTLVTDDGQHIQAHKIILSAGTPFFSDIFLKSNKANMLIYLKGINSVELEHLLDFIYNGEASVRQEKLNDFIETGKELQVKGFESYVSGKENTEGDPVRTVDEKEAMYENRENETITEENNICDTFEPSSEHHFSSEVAFKDSNGGKIQINGSSDLDMQIIEMLEKSDGVWKCKVCGKTTQKCSNIKVHAESHIEGMSLVCNICNKSFPYRGGLRDHIRKNHSELSSCDICGKSGMNKNDYYNHKRRQHKTFSGTLKK